MTKRRQLIVSENYPRIATSIQGPLIEVLSHAREACGDDLDKFLIMLVILSRTTEHPDFKRFTPAQLQAGEVAVLPSLGTNIRSIASSVGIPKETVRRKLAELLQSGWLVRTGRDFRVTAHGYRELAATRESLARLALRYSDLIAVLFREVGESPWAEGGEDRAIVEDG